MKASKVNDISIIIKIYNDETIKYVSKVASKITENRKYYSFNRS